MRSRKSRSSGCRPSTHGASSRSMNRGSGTVRRACVLGVAQEGRPRTRGERGRVVVGAGLPTAMCPRAACPLARSPAPDGWEVAFAPARAPRQVEDRAAEGRDPSVIRVRVSRRRGLGQPPSAGASTGAEPCDVSSTRREFGSAAQPAGSPLPVADLPAVGGGGIEVIGLTTPRRQRASPATRPQESTKRWDSRPAWSRQTRNGRREPFPGPVPEYGRCCGPFFMGRFRAEAAALDVRPVVLFLMCVLNHRSSGGG